MSSSNLRSRHLPPLLHLFVLAAALFPIISSEYQNVIIKCEAELINNKKALEDFDSVTHQLIHSGSYKVNTSDVYGLSWCRHDISPKYCSSCLATAVQRIKAQCLVNVISARCLYFDYCYLRVEPKDFYGEVDTSIINLQHDANVGVDIRHGNSYWFSVMQHLNNWVYDTELHMRKYGEDGFDLPAASVRVNSMALCSPDLTTDGCGVCLRQVYGVMLQQCFYTYTFCEQIFPSCFMIYWTKPK